MWSSSAVCGGLATNLTAFQRYARASMPSLLNMEHRSVVPHVISGTRCSIFRSQGVVHYATNVYVSDSFCAQGIDTGFCGVSCYAYHLNIASACKMLFNT